LRGCDYNNSSHSDKKRTGAGGVQDRAAARWRKMVIGELAAIAFMLPGERKQRKESQRMTQPVHSSFRDKTKQARALDNGSGGLKARSVNGGVGGQQQ
jgi:hypothetical protein